VLLPVLSSGYGGLAPMYSWLLQVGMLCCLFDWTSRNCLVWPTYIHIPSIISYVWLLPDLSYVGLSSEWVWYIHAAYTTCSVTRTEIPFLSWKDDNQVLGVYGSIQKMWCKHSHSVVQNQKKQQVLWELGNSCHRGNLVVCNLPQAATVQPYSPNLTW